MGNKTAKNHFNERVAMTKRIDLSAHYRDWSFEAVLVDVVSELSVRFKDRTPEIIRWANDIPCNNTSLLKEKGIALTYVDDVALTHLTWALQQSKIAKQRLIEVLTSYIAYQGEEKKHGE